MTGAHRSLYILLPVISCLFGILLIELGLAIFYPIPFSLEKNMYFEPDPYTGFRHKALSQGSYPTGIDALANSRGHRDAEVEIPKPAGIFRILMIGDSFTVGANVEQSEAYPQQLERILNAGAGGKFEVVNAGVGGWSPFQYAEFLEHYGELYQPDLVLVGLFVGNDIYLDRFAVEQTLTAVLGRRVSREAVLNRWTTLRILAYENSHTARALMRIKPDNMNFVRDDCTDFTEYYVAIQKKRIDAHKAKPTGEESQLAIANVAELKRMQSIANEMGVKLLVVVLPDENQINPALQEQVIPADEQREYDFNMPQKFLQDIFETQDIASLDLLDVIRSDERCLYMNDTHWVPAGHLLVAEQIRDYLRSSGLVPQAVE